MVHLCNGYFLPWFTGSQTPVKGSVLSWPLQMDGLVWITGFAAVGVIVE